MANDWKDALAGLMASGNIPEDKTPDSREPKEDEKPGAYPKQELNVVFERKGRGGKLATIIEGFTLSDDKVAEIATKLRRSLGTGGSSRGGEILLQGDCRPKAAALLRAMGFRVKGVC